MTETATFSAMVDEVVARSHRKDRINDIVSYSRATMRECHVLAQFTQSMTETQLVATASPHIWTRPLTLRNILICKYPYFDRQGKPVYATEKRPDTIGVNDKYFFYLSGNSFVFSGIELGDSISLAYFTYFAKLKYYAVVADRPATFDDETNLWSYLDAWDDNDTLKEEARDKVTNWLLFHWYDLVVEGTLAKLYKAVNDERSRATFALYKSQQKDLLAGESQIYVGVR